MVKTTATLHNLLQKNTAIHVIYVNYFFNTGKNVSAEWPGSTRVKKDGLYLSISPVTAANQGEYVCLVRENSMEIIRTYTVTVDGEEHAVSLLHKNTFFVIMLLKHFEFGWTLMIKCSIQHKAGL